MGTRLSEGETLQRMKTAFADPAGIGDNQIVAAPGAGFKIVVYGYEVWNNAATAQNARFRSAANNKSPLMAMLANAAEGNKFDAGLSTIPLFECNENEALNLNLSAATAVGVMIQFGIERV